MKAEYNLRRGGGGEGSAKSEIRLIFDLKIAALLVDRNVQNKVFVTHKGIFPIWG